MGFHVCLNNGWHRGPKLRKKAANRTVYEWRTETQVKRREKEQRQLLNISLLSPGVVARDYIPSLLRLLWAPGNFGSGIANEKHPAQPIWWKEPGELNAYFTPYALCFSSGPSRAANTCKMGSLLCSRKKYGQEKLDSGL